MSHCTPVTSPIMQEPTLMVPHLLTHCINQKLLFLKPSQISTSLCMKVDFLYQMSRHTLKNTSKREVQMTEWVL